MTLHWADLVVEKRKKHGDIALGIDPLMTDIPDCFKAPGLSPAETIKNYVSFLLEVSEGQIGIVKYQSAFFEALGSAGLEALAFSIAAAKKRGHGVILDAKRGDVGGTAKAYARAYLTPASAGSLSDLEVDCLTVNPFLGPETLEPFVDCARKYGKGLFVLVKTSNPGSGWLQDKSIDGQLVSDRVAGLVGQWAQETKGDCGLSSIGAVVGATYPEDGRRLRSLMPISFFLAPGLGPQGGKTDSIASLKRDDGLGVLAPVQRGITQTDDLKTSKQAYGDLVQERIKQYKQALG